MAMIYSIKQVSEKTNLPSHTLRYYEKEGLLPFVKRSEGGIRRFTDDDLEWLGLICCLKETGMPIKQIKEFVDLSVQGGGTLRQRCKILIEHKKNVENEIQIMQQHLQKVTTKINHFSAQYEEYAGR
ncbi:MerR family transcriptional regulator [Paenibacillus fonticola]|uniref:MerR family transcriptional regulator n=1 Tax=Paenibacillus fonticola TaxID=379896 RepID=UPI00036691CD|nr:MerR family transcriptional regulator [Paenibacillus fonticola]